jgi:uncharacterized cupredoxin-like copper-binding protein
VVVLALSTGQKLGLLGVAAVFIAFALTSSFLLPRRDPDFPGRRGLPWFVLASLGLFVGMMTTVIVLGKESEGEAASGETTTATTEAGGGGATVAVAAHDFRFTLARRSFPAGTYTFELTNDGKSNHNLVVDGPGVKDKGTPTIAPGKSAKVTVTLKSGSYEIYCSVPGHKQLGMDVKLTVT